MRLCDVDSSQCAGVWWLMGKYIGSCIQSVTPRQGQHSAFIFSFIVNPKAYSLALTYWEDLVNFFKVTGLVLRGIFLLRKKEIDWFYEGGAAAIFPDGRFFCYSDIYIHIKYLSIGGKFCTWKHLCTSLFPIKGQLKTTPLFLQGLTCVHSLPKSA